MNPITLDPVAAYDKWLSAPETLTSDERLVSLVREFEILADMEGWYHFFTYDHYLCFYEEVKSGLQTVGDTDSLGVLADHEQYLRRHGVAMEPDAIEAFLFAQEAEASHDEAISDWGDEFNRHYETRWAKIAQYLQGRGIEMRYAEEIHAS